MFRQTMNVIRGLDRLAEWLVFDVAFGRCRGLVILLLAVGMIAWGFSGARTPAPAPAAVTLGDSAGGEHLLMGRPWIDKRPTHIKDPFCLYVFDKRRLDRSHFLGVYIFGNPLKHTFEFFGYTVKGGAVQFWFPNDDTKFESPFNVAKERNGRFDLKLSLKADPRHDGGPYVYWGRTDGDLSVPVFDEQFLKLLVSPEAR